MMASLEWGLFDYARGVLDNWLTYFIKDRGFVLYRGLEMSQHGRMLTNIAQYYAYTQDGQLLLKHLDKIKGIVWMLRQRRASALATWPTNDSRYGMPTGNDEADLFWTTVGHRTNATELPFISIAAEMWRGFRDCGEVLSIIGTNSTSPNTEAAALGRAMLVEADEILPQLRASMLAGEPLDLSFWCPK